MEKSMPRTASVSLFAVDTVDAGLCVTGTEELGLRELAVSTVNERLIGRHRKTNTDPAKKVDN